MNERLTVQGATSKTPVTGHLAKFPLTLGKISSMEDRGDVSVTGVFEERRTHEAATLTWLALFFYFSQDCFAIS